MIWYHDIICSMFSLWFRRFDASARVEDWDLGADNNAALVAAPHNFPETSSARHQKFSKGRTTKKRINSKIKCNTSKSWKVFYLPCNLSGNKNTTWNHVSKVMLAFLKIYLCWFVWPKGHMHKTWIGSVASHCQSQFTMAKTGVNCQIRLFVSVVATFDCQRLKCMKRHGKVLLKFPERCLLFIIMTWCTPGFQKFAAQFRYTKYYKAIVSKSLLPSNPQTCCLLFDRCISLKSFQNQTFWR